MVQIKRMLLSQSQANVPNRSMTPRYITIHDTANTSRGADAYMHAKYQKNGSGGRQASWHYQVDDTEIWQSLLDTQQGWHAGDGGGKGNTQSIGIETCINSDGDFNKTVKNVQSLVKSLMDKHDIPLSRVVSHQKWSGKYCPRQIFDRIGWSNFKNGISGGGSVAKPKTGTTPKKSTTPKNTNSIVDYLNSLGQDSSFTNRSKLARQYGISNYRGTASQNTELLNKMQTSKPTTSQPSGGSGGSSYKGNSIVDYLSSIGVNSSFTNRQRLARQYGVSNYRGTASQNTDLLNRMRKGVQVSSPSRSKRGDQKTTSIVDYLNSIGENSSFSNRKRLASRYGIRNYRGTASQNTQLLNKMRG